MVATLRATALRSSSALSGRPMARTIAISRIREINSCWAVIGSRPSRLSSSIALRACSGVTRLSGTPFLRLLGWPATKGIVRDGSVTCSIPERQLLGLAAPQRGAHIVPTYAVLAAPVGWLPPIDKALVTALSPRLRTRTRARSRQPWLGERARDQIVLGRQRGSPRAR